MPLLMVDILVSFHFCLNLYIYFLYQVNCIKNASLYLFSINSMQCIVLLRALFLFKEMYTKKLFRLRKLIFVLLSLEVHAITFLKISGRHLVSFHFCLNLYIFFVSNKLY